MNNARLEFEGEVVMVSGAASGIGLAIARALAAEGAIVALDPGVGTQMPTRH